MTLRLRLGLIVGGSLLAGIVLFGGAAYGLFTEAQDRQLQDLVERDLDRLATLIRDPVVGAPLLRSEETVYVEQFVSTSGVVVLPRAAIEPLPLHTSPTLDRSLEPPRMISSVPWTASSGAELGTIRLALDVSDALADRRTLMNVLIGTGAVIAALMSVVALLVVRRALSPLADLAVQARHVDPARPAMTTYRGPDDEVAAVATALNRALESIRARQDEERASLAEVAHELAAPLTVVAGQLQVLARSHAEDGRVRAAHEAAQELLHTSQDLLTLARGELEHALELEIVDLRGIAERVAAEFPGVTGVASGDTQVVGDPSRLRQLVRNLVRNAVQATGATDGVSWELESMDGRVLLMVRDQGPGIAREDLAKVFDRFHSGRGGAGLGLAVARRLVAQHEGTIEVRSDVGVGTQFTVSFPDVDSRMDAEEDDA